MRANQRKIVLMALAILPVQGWTGNRALMEQNARELIGVNQAILDALHTGIQDGEYRLSARVTTGPGQPLFQVDHLEVTGAERAADAVPSAIHSPLPWATSAAAPTVKGTPASPNVLAPFGHGSPSLRFGPIPDQVEMAATPAKVVTAAPPTTPGQTDQRAPAPLDPLTLSTAPAQLGAHHLPLEDASHPVPPDSPTTGGGAVLKPW